MTALIHREIERLENVTELTAAISRITAMLDGFHRNKVAYFR